MNYTPDIGDRVQELYPLAGSERRRGVLMDIRWPAGWDREAVVWWDGDVDAHTVDLDLLELEPPR